MPIDPSVAHLSGPIAGSSLTRAPGSVPWEKPPQYTSVDDAMQFFVKAFQNPDNVHQFLATIEAGAPLDVTIYTILSHGFAEGKWTPSLMILLIKPLTMLLHVMLDRAKIKYIATYTPQKGKLDSLFDLVNQKKTQEKVTSQQVSQFVKVAKDQVAPTTPDIPAPASAGLMSPPQGLNA
jgi:hypothetical protein